MAQLVATIAGCAFAVSVSSASGPSRTSREMDSPRAPEARSNTVRAAGDASSSSRPIPTNCAPWPGKSHAVLTWALPQVPESPASLSLPLSLSVLELLDEEWLLLELLELLDEELVTPESTPASMLPSGAMGPPESIIMAGRSIMRPAPDQPSGGAEQATIPRTERPTPRSTRPSNRDREALRRGLNCTSRPRSLRTCRSNPD